MDQSNQHKTYLVLLKETLIKKINILRSLLEYTLEQERLANLGNIEGEEFDAAFTEKDKLLKTLAQLDDGFEQIYLRVKEVVTTNASQYQEEIKELQELILKITDINVNLQATEERNKIKIENTLIKKRKEIKNFKISNQTASSYYKNMANQHQGESYFLDKKN
ncbi:MAG: hypothetical protein PHF63_02865 [Herbinix sp.]|nr:hypothetical protein [Herbinix sp.]